MNKELIEKRIADLKKQLENVQATGNALVGAIQDCEYWLSQLGEKEVNEQSEDVHAS